MEEIVRHVGYLQEIQYFLTKIMVLGGTRS